MESFEVGETVICSLEIKKGGDYYDPSSVKISIYREGTIDVDEASMTRDATGKYSYNYQTTGKLTGKYRAKFTAIDGDDKSIKNGAFKLI